MAVQEENFQVGPGIQFPITPEGVLLKYAALVQQASPGGIHDGHLLMAEQFNINTPEVRLPNYELPANPPLPPTLKIMDVRRNLLKRLPEQLPPALEYLDCDYNFISKLPELPQTLQILKCNKNRLRTLPLLPDSLAILECYNNPFIEPYSTMVNEAKVEAYQERYGHILPPAAIGFNDMTGQEIFTRILRDKLKKYYVVQPRYKNLTGFTDALEPTTGANWYYGTQKSKLTTLPANILAGIGSQLSGEKGTLKQQKLKLQEKLSRPDGAPGVGGRRKTRKARKTRKNQSKRQVQ